MRILNLYAGIGGNRKLWDNAHVTAVELDPAIAETYKYFFPDDQIIIGDAHEYLLKNYDRFDFIWSSPPCQSHSLLNTALNAQGVVRYPDMKLYEEIIFLKHFFSGPWVVENVKPYYRPLIEAQKMCRHLFWTNFHIRHKDINDKSIGMVENEPPINTWRDILGFDISKIKKAGVRKRSILRNCVLPELGKHILDCAMGALVKEEQGGLFA